MMQDNSRAPFRLHLASKVSHPSMYPEMRHILPSVRWSLHQRSAIAFAVVLALAMFAISLPEMPAQVLLGMLYAGAGFLFLVFPPVARLPRVWWVLGVGFLILSLAGFIPRGWTGMPGWRQDLEVLGLDTGPLAIVQVPLAVEALCSISVIALLAIYLLGHRVDSRAHLRLTLGFVVFCALWVMAALVAYEPGAERVFGFFANRNHTATLLAMAVFAALGCLVHGIEHKKAMPIVISTVGILLFLHAILSVSESRSGVLLLVIGFLFWVPLAGTRHLRGHAGKAMVLLLFGLAAGLLVTDTRVKERLVATISMDGAEGAVAKDARLGIQQDALRMIAAEPWCGVGPGQFAWIFPQYRQHTPVSSETPCLHPESDWLMIAAENGWPAALCLAAGASVIFLNGANAARKGRSRVLRTACIVSAGLLCVHGFIDVPGHRSGLALGAVLLLALSMRPQEEGTTRGAASASRWPKAGWMAAGLLMGALGFLLLRAQWSGRPVLPSVVAKTERQRAQQLREMDRAASEAARQAGVRYRPSREADTLRLARTSIDRVTMIEPLDPGVQFVRGVMALHFNGGEETAREAFAIQRRLEPQQSRLLLKQADVWAARHPDHVKELWELAVLHAAAEQRRVPGTQHAVKNIYESLFADAAVNPDLAPLAFEFAIHDFARLEKWMRYTPSVLIERYFPEIPADKLSADERGMLLAEFSRKGSAVVVEDFKRANPDFAMPRPSPPEGK